MHTATKQLWARIGTAGGAAALAFGMCCVAPSAVKLVISFLDGKLSAARVNTMLGTLTPTSASQ
jgi:hypothetical protein